MESYTEHLGFLKKKALQIRIELLQMLHHAQSGHLGGALSVVDILTVIYNGVLPGRAVLSYDPKKPQWEEQDYFILSKGHASAAWYTVLADCGFFPKEDLLDYRKVNSRLQSYPFQKTPGVILTTGTPGYGVSAACGIAMGLKLDKKPNRVICLAGDGELQSGDFWEAVLVAAQYKLDNLTLVVDLNGLQMDGTVRSVVGIDPVSDKLETFGWKTIPVHDGHDYEDLLLGFEKAYEVQRRPAAILAKTVKGKGVLFAENKASYHAEVLSEEEIQCIEDIGKEFNNWKIKEF